MSDEAFCLDKLLLHFVNHLQATLENEKQFEKNKHF